MAVLNWIKSQCSPVSWSWQKCIEHHYRFGAAEVRGPWVYTWKGMCPVVGGAEGFLAQFRLHLHY